MLVIKDANIFFDLHEIGLLDLLFISDLEVCMTDFVTELEISEPAQRETLNSIIEQGRIKVLHSTNTDIVKINEIRERQSNRLSIPDCSILYFAQELHATILTNDGLLRSVSRKNNLEAHGIIWLFDRWVAGEMISRSDAAQKMYSLWQINNWLPYEEISKRIERWSGGRMRL